MTTDDIAAFRKLNIGRIGAVYSNKDVGLAIIKKENLKNIRYVGSQKEILYYIGFVKSYNDKDTVDKFNNALEKLYSEGKIKKILDKYNIKSAEIK